MGVDQSQERPDASDAKTRTAATAAGPDGASTVFPESRAERLRRSARRVRLYTGAVALVALLAVLVVLISVNRATVKLDWAVGSTRASLVWIILAAAVIGWLLGMTTAIVFHHRTRRRR
jgi:uncharacterized integral membrane protein